MRLTAAIPLLAVFSASWALAPGQVCADDNLSHRPYSVFRSAAVLRGATDVDTRVKTQRRALFKASIPDEPVAKRSPTTVPSSVAPVPAAATTAANGRELTLQRTSFTPYDRYLGSVRTVIANLDTRDPGMVKACALVREGRRFRYHATDPYRAALPAVTAARQEGDCKAKALWLFEQLGDPSAFYVIGKLERRSQTSHAWVYWHYADRWWILDPTARSAPIAADSVSPQRYVPYYSFGKTGTFRHSATRLLMAQADPAAASAPIAISSSALEARGKRLSHR